MTWTIGVLFLIITFLIAQWYFRVSTTNVVFTALFLFRYIRFVIHTLSFSMYKPTRVPKKPKFAQVDTTVIIPTVNPEGSDFEECIRSILGNNPFQLIVCTPGEERFEIAKSLCAAIDPAITVIKASKANKRVQVDTAIDNILAPFNDPTVGLVGTSKRACRHALPCFSIEDFMEFLGCVYLERANFDTVATSNVDGGVAVISGRTVAMRTRIVQDPAFRDSFLNERFFFGWYNLPNADDDNFITRWMVTKGYGIRFQYCEEATITTTVGQYPKFLGQCLRWSRTTWRSNTASLLTDGTVWRTQPWCVYAVHVTSLINFALFYDGAMIALWGHCSWSSQHSMAWLIIWILGGKMVKPCLHFYRYPKDLVYLPGYILFGYYHSIFIKLRAALTFYDASWGTRPGVEDK
ncbi:hypothetical protein BT96DRAFT_1026770 [Gymnopus androsaceus JB14]|uniref:Glycosyltransferase family 2 protein n=1 Tax=Gymnopus androsaceus JB14 TaxID=1447944 RepID=A0A6A4GGW0_9AGAR|nr:hypothetical protein BT96DRAFT_1026770 [Gymnopus androsaceus JB14]